MPLISPRKQMQFLYRRAAGPDDFPWHEDKPTRVLEEAVASRPTRGRALDLGCGSGFYTVYLAQQGFEVTGVDFVSDAIAMARERATAAGVAVELVEADVLEWESPSTFELVLDRGMLNLLRAGDVAEYRRRLFHWLAPGGDYVLDHALKRDRAIGVHRTHQAQRGGDPRVVRARPGASSPRALRCPGAAAGRALALLRRVLVSPARLVCRAAAGGLSPRARAGAPRARERAFGSRPLSRGTRSASSCFAHRPNRTDGAAHALTHDCTQSGLLRGTAGSSEGWRVYASFGGSSTAAVEPAGCRLSRNHD